MNAAIAEIEASAHVPLRLPSIDEVETHVRRLDERLKQDPESAREQLRRWLRDGSIRVGPREDGAVVAEGAVLPVIVIEDNQKPKSRNAPEQFGAFLFVAGAGFASVSIEFVCVLSLERP